MGDTSLLTKLVHLDEKLIRAMLREQRREFESNGAYSSSTISGLVTSRSADWLLKNGLDLLARENPEERVIGTRLIRELGDPQRQTAIEALTDRLQVDGDEVVVAWLIAALSMLHATSALSLIIDFAYYPYADARDAVADAISACSGGVLSGRGLEALLKLSTDIDESVRFSSIFELGTWWETGHPDQRIEQALRHARQDPAVLVRRAAIAALDSSDQPSPPS